MGVVEKDGCGLNVVLCDIMRGSDIAAIGVWRV
jgi:hypothetical protein